MTVKNINTITVQKSGGDFTSIKDAVNSINDSSSTNGYVINVGPGQFHEEEINFTGKQYISVVGSDIQITQVIAKTSEQNLFILDSSVELSFMTLKGVGPGYAAIICEDLNGFSLVHKLSMYDCDTMVLVRASTLFTQFYGEYIDFNGDYSYGIKVESNNGVLAFANAENYYNFPGVTGSIGNWASGANSVINILGNANTGFGYDKAFYIENGANLTITSCDITGYEKGIVVGNVGTASRFDIDATSIVDCKYNMYIDHPNTFGTFQGSNSHKKIYNQSQNVYWGFLDNEDGEFDITRKISITNSDGSHVDLSTLIFEGSAMGVLSGGSISKYTGLTVSISTGYGYLETFSGNIIRIDWDNTLFMVNDNSAKYIYINENSLFSQSNTLPDIQSNIVFGRVVTQAGSVVLIDSSKIDVYHVGDNLKLFNRNALGSIYNSGSAVTSATYSLNVTDGSYYFGSRNYLPSGGLGITFSQYLRNGGSWTITETNLVTSQYDNNTGSLVGMSASYFTKHTLYVSGDGVNQKYLLVVGQIQYNNINLVETAALPLPPIYFIDSVTPIASIVVRQGTPTIYEVIDVRPVIGFKSTGINSSSLHSNLVGLSADDHTQYLLVSGSRAMQGNLIMASNSIIGVGQINGVTIESHSSRHLPNGSDPLTTGVPSTIGTTNQEGIQNAFARQDHIHAHGNQIGDGLHATASSSSAGFMSATDKVLLDAISNYNNTVVGYQSLRQNTTGYNNTTLGIQTLYLNTTGYNNIAIGYNSLYNNTTGNYNTSVGVQSLYLNTSGYRNTTLGYNSLYSNVNGYDNTAIGYNSLSYNTTGSGNVGVGNGSLQTSTTAINLLGTISGGSGYVTGTYSSVQLIYATGSTAITYPTATIVVGPGGTVSSVILVTKGSGFIDTTTILSASSSTVGGTGSGFSIAVSSLASASSNTAIGVNSLSYNTTGYNNTAIGYSSLRTNATGYQNTAIGMYSLYSNTSGYQNTSLGYYTLVFNTTGYQNVALGVQSLQSNTTGYYNTAVGFQALATNTTGYDNTAIGYNALVLNTTGYNNTALGMYSLYANTSGANNTALGYNSLTNNTSGSYSVAIGYQTLQANTTGISNTALGYQALYSNITGGNNIAIGYNAGYLISGTTSGATTPSNSIFIGYGTRPSSGNNTNETVIGFGSLGLGSNTTVLGNSSTVTTAIYGRLLLGPTSDNGLDKVQISDTTLAGGGTSSSLTGSLLNMTQTWNTGGTPTAIKLNVTDTASNSGNLIDLQVGGTSKFSVSKSGYTIINDSIFITNFIQAGYLNTKQNQIFSFQYQGSGNLTGNISDGASHFRFFNNLPTNSTTGTNNHITIFPTFSPTSGNAIWNTLNIAPIINQTAGVATGITRGLYINPTLTSAADFRAIETVQGQVIHSDTYMSGTGSLAGSLLNLSQTWNTTGTPTAIKLNVTNTNSNANSLLMDLQVGGVSKHSVDRLGNMTATTYNGYTPASQDGTILYHSLVWFTPTGTVSSSGTTVTSIGTQFTSAMVGAKLTISGESRIITAYISTTQVTVASAYSQNYSGVALGNWGVYSKVIEILPNQYTYYNLYDSFGVVNQQSAGTQYYIKNLRTLNNNLNFIDSGYVAGGSRYVGWTNNTSGANEVGGALDTALRRNAAGILEIYDGITATGLLANRRDLLVRGLSASIIQVNGSFTASNNLAQGSIITPNLSASTNNDVLVGLDINPNYVGGVGASNTIVGGTLYVTGTYSSVPLTGGNGTGALATIIVSGGAVTTVTVTTAGSGYYLGNTLSAASANIGGTGSGFTLTLNTLSNTGVKPIGLRVDGINIGRGNGYNIRNLSIGSSALVSNTLGVNNIALGTNSLLVNTIGNNNIAIGEAVLISNINGSQNIGIGQGALQNSVGSNNNSIGQSSLNSITSGANNIAFGRLAGRYIADKTTLLTSIDNSILLGHQASPLGQGQANQIVIGYDATGLGSNTTVLGNTSTLTTAIYGRTLHGTTVDDGVNQLQVSGGTLMTNSAATTTLRIVGTGSGTTLPVFTVQGSQGELFSITDNLTGSLFSVNDISGLPILEAFSDNTVLMGSYLAPSLNTTVKLTVATGSTTIYSIPVATYTGAFIDYTINDGTNLRAGTVTAVWNSSTVQYKETFTSDIGSTTGLTFSVVISGTNAALKTSVTAGSWVVKTIIRSI